jgi:cell division initiation protein
MEELRKSLQRKRRFSPSEIRNKEFNKKLFGYDPEEVESFLMEVANAYQELLKEVERLRVKTPEYKTKELIEKAKKEIEKIVEKKKEEKEALERKKEEIELEIEKLRLAQKKIYDRLKIAIIEMTRILEELRTDVKGEKKEGRDRDRDKSPAQELKESSGESGSGKAESKDNGAS